MYKIIVELKQHTPIIHFQPEQEGATLRASELKPLMNQYLEEKYHNKYQMKLISKNKVRPKEPGKELLFFGNQGSEQNKWLKTLEGQKISLEINPYFDQTLKNKLHEILPIVLTLNNFGNRKNKGTGCYTAETQTRDQFEDILKEHVYQKTNHKVYYWDINEYSAIGEVFESIKFFYSLLKSGITVKLRDKPQRTDYSSLLYRYFLENPRLITWEKAKIKSDWAIGHTTKTEENTFTKHTTNNKFIRALLGTGENQMWMSEDRRNIKIEFPVEYERIPSSLVFKIFTTREKNTPHASARIYFWANDDYKKLLDKPFVFKSAGKKDINIDTPSNFDIEDFLDWSKKEISNLSINNNSGNDVYGLIKRVDKIMLHLQKGGLNTL